MRPIIFSITFLLIAAGCTQAPEPGIPSVSVSIETVGETVYEQETMVETHFINLLNQHLGDEFRLIKGIGDSGLSIHGTIKRLHSETEQLQVALVVESQDQRHDIQQNIDLNGSAMERLSLLIQSKLSALETSVQTHRPQPRVRQRDLIIRANYPGTLSIFAEETVIERKQLPGSNLPVPVTLDGTRGYRFVAVPLDSGVLDTWTSISSYYWPPRDTMVIEFSK